MAIDFTKSWEINVLHGCNHFEKGFIGNQWYRVVDFNNIKQRNRIAALFAAAKEKSSSEQVGRAAVTRAIEDGASLWARPDAPFSLGALRTYAEGLSKTDWRPAQGALLLLARRDQPGAANAVS